jgi:hypothetical protein
MGRITLLRLTAIVVVTAALAGCSGAALPIDSPIPTASPIETPVSPSAVEPAGTPVAQMTVVVPTPPTPQTGKGVIYGQLFLEGVELPMLGVELYLGDHIGVQDDVPLYGLDPESAQHTLVVDGGYFVFDDVPPGRYVLVVWNAASPRLARNPDTGVPLDLTMEPDQVINVGVLAESMQ